MYRSSWPPLLITEYEMVENYREGLGTNKVRAKSYIQHGRCFARIFSKSNVV